jgi:2-dehydropantoate 2-reductase
MGKYKFGVIGVGPTGAILAGYLAAKGEDVVIVDIKYDHMTAIRKNGLHLTGMADMIVRFDKTHTSVPMLKKYDLDILFVATKTYSLRPVLHEIRGVFRNGMKIVCYQNGVDNEEEVVERFGPEAAIRMVVNHAGNLLDNGVIKMTFFHKPNYIGCSSPESVETAREIAKIMTSCGLDTEFTDDIKFREWEKTIFNTALAPISALTGQTMKEVMTQPETRELVDILLREAIYVAEANGVNLGENFYEKGIYYLGTAGNHKPSMRIDIEEGHQTEIDFITGKIVERGEKTEKGCPVNQTLYNLIKGLEVKI